MRSLSRCLILVPLGALSACAGNGPAPPATVATRPPPTPKVAAPSLQVMGGEARALIAQFGTPAIDQREGPARKLQFRGSGCVLDAYLYPPADGGTPRVTWLDARTPQGNDMDRTACIAALSKR